MVTDEGTVTLTWRPKGAKECNRLTVSRWALAFWGGLCLAATASAIVLGAVVVEQHRESEALRREVALRKGREASLAERLAEASAEIARARDGLARVRAEEAKIRSWLGLERDEEEASPGAAPREPGGRGSLGEVALEAVAPADRSAESGDGEPAPEGIGTAAGTLADDLADLARRVQEQKRHWDAIPAISPVADDHWISSAFGWRRSPFTGKREFHSGIDMAGRRGTPIVAAADGSVVRVVRDRNLGRAVTLDHGNGIQTIYGHLDRVLVKKGQRVRRGEEIGEMGSTGRRSTGPHLHYAVKVDGKYVNPRNYMLDRGALPYAGARR